MEYIEPRGVALGLPQEEAGRFLRERRALDGGQSQPLLINL
jgi:hypothetical protein